MKRKQVTKETIEQIQKKTPTPQGEYLGDRKDAEPFQVANHYIESNYRIGFNTVGKVLKSLFLIHNESFNIWSHLLTAILFIWFIIYTAIYMAPPGIFSNNNLYERWSNDISHANQRNSLILSEFMMNTSPSLSTSSLGGAGAHDSNIN
jgi:hypothetical protein